MLEEGEPVGRGVKRRRHIDLRWLHGVERGLAGSALGRVEAHRRAAELAQGLADLTVADHHHVASLAVATRRGEPGDVEDAVEHLVRDRIVGELPAGKGGSHGFVQVHVASLGGPGWVAQINPGERPGHRAASSRPGSGTGW